MYVMLAWHTLYTYPAISFILFFAVNKSVCGFQGAHGELCSPCFASLRRLCPWTGLHRSLAVVGSSGLEPPTSRLSGVRSNQLSYEPVTIRLCYGQLAFG